MTTKKKIEINDEIEIRTIIEELTVKTKNQLIIWKKSSNMPKNLNVKISPSIGYQADIGRATVYVNSHKNLISADFLIRLKKHDAYFKANFLTTDVRDLLQFMSEHAESDELTDLEEYQEFKKALFNLNTN